MVKLIMTRGLPGSGKTTWAVKELERLHALGQKCYIVCKDDIRAALELTGWKWSRENEKEVIKIRDQQIKAGLTHHDVVISADTNFGNHKADLQRLAKEAGAEFEVKDFTSVPLETCIQRDAKRERSVGEMAIRGMYERYVALPSVEIYTPITDKPSAIISDLDGTLALFNGQRSPYDTGRCGTDLLNGTIADIVRTYAINHKVIYVSGREDKFRDVTETWLGKHSLPHGPLFMRTTGDHRKDYIVKLELFNEYIRQNYNVRFVLDDRNQVVQMWRKLGLTCLQVAEGDF